MPTFGFGRRGGHADPRPLCLGTGRLPESETLSHKTPILSREINRVFKSNQGGQAKRRERTMTG